MPQEKLKTHRLLRSINIFSDIERLSRLFIVNIGPHGQTFELNTESCARRVSPPRNLRHKFDQLHDAQRQTLRIDQRVNFATLHLFTGVVAGQAVMTAPFSADFSD